MDGDKMKRGWKHFYATELPFTGYKKISPSMVTMGFGRDIIFDPFAKIPEGEGLSDKPKVKGVDSVKKWIAKIAENQRQTYRAKPKSVLLTNIITWTEVGVIALLGGVLLLRMLT